MVTRQPTGQDLVCLVCHKQAQDIDHVVNRGMGGSKARDVPENKVPLCRECHELKTQGYINTEIKWDGGGGRVYRWQRRLFKDNEGSLPWIVVPVEVSQRYGCLVGRLSDGAEVSDAPASSPRPSASSLSQEEEPVLSAAAEDSAGEYVLTAQAQGNAPGEKRQRDKKPRPSSAAAPSTGPKEESDGEQQDSASDAEGLPVGVAAQPPEVSVGGAGDERRVAPNADGGARGSSSLTHEQRVAIAKEIKDTEWQRQFYAGDTALAWRQDIGEEAEQYLSDFGYVQEALANILRVCEQIPSVFRNENLRFSHHVVVAGLNREDMEMWLDKCEEEQWSVAEFRRQVKGTKPKVKRWTLEELRELMVDLCADPHEFQGKELDPGDVAHSIDFFLDWLGEQQ